jgi:hypothetical protein
MLPAHTHREASVTPSCQGMQVARSPALPLGALGFDVRPLSG